MNAFGSRLLADRGRWMERLGRLETGLLRDKLDTIDTSRPIYVCGLARSGTTILLELIAAHSDVASQRYLDYPFVFTPFLWNRFLGSARRTEAPRRERAHKDGLMVSADSPEAMEEPIWMHFFPDCHNPTVNNVLGADTRNAAFEAFYDAHVAKLLLVRERSRYAAKGNYHIARLGYLANLYPGARFLIPVRDPVSLIASSIRQHRRFSQGQRQNVEARQYLSQVGHFEFGLDRAPINVDRRSTRQVMAMWDAGDEIGGWSLYWSTLHDHIADIVTTDPGLRERVMIIPYEALCTDPVSTGARMCEFCALPQDPPVTAFAAERIKPQHYYRVDFSNEDLARIAACTGASLERISALADTRWRDSGSGTVSRLLD